MLTIEYTSAGFKIIECGDTIATHGELDHALKHIKHIILTDLRTREDQAIVRNQENPESQGLTSWANFNENEQEKPPQPSPEHVWDDELGWYMPF